jgi:3-oxoacyl-[acyl-carrier protein] reductase
MKMKRVLITGGTRGISKAMVELFAKEGYKVAFTYKNSIGLAEELESRYGALAIRADSASEDDIFAAVARVVDAFGGVDVLINNAGISSFSMLQDISLKEWNECIGTNLTAAFLYSREVSPYMIRQQYGRIINITSMWGLVGASCEAHYSAAKAGLIGLTKALSKELGPSGITVNAIAPGVIDTDMNSHLSAEDMDALAEDTPVGRIGRAEEVARAALYLAGENASFITGDVLNISGGFVI